MERDHLEHREPTNDFSIKGAAKRAAATPRHHGEVCVICLERISERAVAVPCNHLSFDFLCLVSWLQEQDKCPLCKATVTEVQYDWRDPEDYKVYRVESVQEAKSSRSNLVQTRPLRHPLLRRSRPGSYPNHRLRNPVVTEDAILARRKTIYQNQLFSLHVGANRHSHFRNFTPQDFASSDELQSKSRIWMRRELQVFSFLNSTNSPRGENADFLLEYIVAILKTVEIKGGAGQAEDLLQEFLGRENARLFLHELEAWLKSPYTKLEDWDRHVQYADGGHGVKGACRSVQGSSGEGG